MPMVSSLGVSEFYKFLSEVEVKHPDLPYHTAVWWLSSSSNIYIYILRIFKVQDWDESFSEQELPLASTFEYC